MPHRRTDSYKILGLNSGTSADGVDFALIDFSHNGTRVSVNVLGGGVRPYSAKIRRELERLITRPDVSAEEAARAGVAYGRYLGEIACEIIDTSGWKAEYIASHGQTIGHFPRRKKILDCKSAASFQIGDIAAVAAVAGVPTIGDFRQNDIALGGEGAPLTPIVNHLLFGHTGRSRVIVNIGGMANYTFLSASGKTADIRGGDCGPGNILLDIACRLLLNKAFDRDGKLASSGSAIQKAVSLITKAGKSKTVSTGRESWDELTVARIIHAAGGVRVAPADILASIASGTAELIHRSIRQYLGKKKPDGVYVTGGGRRNLAMARMLRDKVHPLPVWPVEMLGYDGDILEAVSFAVLGGCFLAGIPSTLPAVTGAESGGIAGKLAKAGPLKSKVLF